MRVILAEVVGMCFGVRAALKTLDEIEKPADTTIHGDLVHNEVVLERLRLRSFRMNGERERHALPQTQDVLVTAHGISRREWSRLEMAGKRLIDTTCPLVVRAHEAAQQLHVEGRFVLVIGRRGHVEVQGIVEDLTQFEVVQGPQEAKSYPFPRLGILCQTTMPTPLVQNTRNAIIRHNPEADVRFIDTVCQPTKEHQDALEKLIAQVQAVVVVGGQHSNNTQEMVTRCREHGVIAFHVQSAVGLQPQWFKGLDRVGLTAGTSTLDETVAEVHKALLRMNFASGLDGAMSDEPTQSGHKQAVF